MTTTCSESTAMPPDTSSGPEATGRHRRHCRGARSHGRPFGGLYLAAIVVGFIIFWPIGVALIAWGFWRDRIKAWPIFQRVTGAAANRAPSFQEWMARPPGNTALAEYLAREQERLKAEQAKLDDLVRAFEEFKAAERRNADQRDFDAFLDQRTASDIRSGSTGDRAAPESSSGSDAGAETRDQGGQSSADRPGPGI